MQELNDLITARMDTMVSSGKLQELIDRQLEKSIKDILDDSLRSYSDFGKQVKERLEKSLAGAVKKVDFPEYSHFISKSVAELVTMHFQNAAYESLQENIKDVLAPVPREATGGWLLNEIAGHIDRDDFEFDGDCMMADVEWDERDDYRAIYICIKAGCGKFRITLYDHKNEGKHYIGHIEDDGGRALTRSLGNSTHDYGLGGFLYKIYCTGTEFTGMEDVYGESITKSA